MEPLPALSPVTSVREATAPPWMYVTPVVVFGIFTLLEPSLPPAWYVLAYTAKLVAVLVSLLVGRQALADIRPAPRGVVAAMAVGVVVFMVWVVVDRLIPYPHLGSRLAFDPSQLPQSTAASFLAIRLTGLILIVPLIEELFWRGYALRQLTANDFRAVPLAEVSWSAFAIVSLLFGLTHPEWLVAIVAGAAYALIARRFNSLFPAIVAHAVSNAALGAYILVTKSWWYW